MVGGGSAPKKISVLFRFLPTLKNNLIFWKKSKSRCSSTDKKWENKVERVSILMGHPVYQTHRSRVHVFYEGTKIWHFFFDGTVMSNKLGIFVKYEYETGKVEKYSA